MGPFLVPATIVAAMLAFAVSALSAGLAPTHQGLWPGAVRLAILGAITPMIYAVTLRVVPVFTRRRWPRPVWPRLQLGLAILGAWLVFASHVTQQGEVAVAGNALTLAGGVIFASSVIYLMRQPASLPPPPMPYAGQQDVDRVATSFMRLAGGYLLVGLTLGLIISVRRPETGRWDLVWAHAMLVGFFLSMASGICYHVLTRWSGRRWKATTPIRLHFVLVAIGLPLMLVALALDNRTLLFIAGPLQALAVALFVANLAHLVPGLPGPTRPAFTAATALLVIGVGLGALFAVEPALGARLRQAHAEVNLFGWTGLLISGCGYYLAPRFMGQPLRWPRLATVQLTVLTAGVSLGAVGWAWRAYGGPSEPIFMAQGLVAAGLLLFAVQIAGMMGRTGIGTRSTLTVVPRAAPSLAGPPQG